MSVAACREAASISWSAGSSHHRRVSMQAQLYHSMQDSPKGCAFEYAPANEKQSPIDEAASWARP